MMAFVYHIIVHLKFVLILLDVRKISSYINFSSMLICYRSSESSGWLLKSSACVSLSFVLNKLQKGVFAIQIQGLLSVDTFVRGLSKKYCARLIVIIISSP